MYWKKFEAIFVLVCLQCLVAAQDLVRCTNCRYGSDYCSEDDRCLFGCQPGFHGDNCKSSCSIKNCVECSGLDAAHEQCVMCSGDVYGLFCNLTCSRHCKGKSSHPTCDVQGNCIFGCEQGYHGDKCDLVACDHANCRKCDVTWQGYIYCAECAAGYYWNVDQNRCARCGQFCATPYDCSQQSGDCKDGCKPGYYGSSCNYHCDIENCNNCYPFDGNTDDARCSVCKEGYYPSSAQTTCLPCSSECTSCDPSTGACTNCEEGTLGDRCQFRCSDISNCDKCKLNYMRTNIQCSECKDRYYLSQGTCQNCSSTCEGRLCDKQTGNCFNCAKGYYGRENRNPHLESCSFECSIHCVNGSCDQDDGTCLCMSGWFGSRCTRGCPVKCSSCIGYQNRKCPSCEAGYFGDMCDKRCSDTCERWSSTGSVSTSLPSCEQSSGYCDFGCLTGYYGPMCNMTCSRNCDGGVCDKNTGDCLAGCTAYWYGSKCDKKCSDNCVDNHISSINRPCDMHTGKCLQGCKGRYFGDRCDQLCNYKCREQICHQDTGMCKYGCMDGFSGRNCSESCGLNCPDQCSNCIDKYCDMTSKHCLKGCVPGFYGVKCQNNCSPKCLDGNCNVSGVCLQCVTGFYGPTCRQECSLTCDGVCGKNNGHCRLCKAGYYGDECNLSCPENCLTLACKQDTGNCKDGCVSGFFGDNCDRVCWDGWYGENCATACGRCKDGTPCLKTTGHCISGCDIGYGGDTCNHALSHAGPVVYDRDKVAMIAGVSVSALLVVAIIIAVALLCYCRSQKAKRAKTEEPTVVFTTARNNLQVVQSGSIILQNESDISLHQIDSNLLGSQEPDIRCSGVVAHRDYYILHRGTVLKHGDREDAYIKVLLLNDTVEKQTNLSWMRKEVEVLELCKNHPNIINLLMTQETPERFSVALSSCMQNNLMPYLHEISLSDDDDVENFYNHQLIQFVIDITDAMCHLHRHQIIHRYLRARSIYLSDNLVAKVGDFDFAILMEDDCPTDDPQGRDSNEEDFDDGIMAMSRLLTPKGETKIEHRDLPGTYSCWLAPEALISNRYSLQSDIWSYGMLLWEIFTLGQWPYDRLEGSKLERAIIHGERPPKPGLASISIYRLMKNCWRYSPDDRPTAELALCHLTETQV